jgi:hypothetical protein
MAALRRGRSFFFVGITFFLDFTKNILIFAAVYLLFYIIYSHKTNPTMTTNTIIGMAAIAALIFNIGFTRAEQVTDNIPHHYCLLTM